MKVQVISHLSWKEELSGEYTLDRPVKIDQFVRSLGAGWNVETLVMVNDRIVHADYELQDGDRVYLLVPIVGG